MREKGEKVKKNILVVDDDELVLFGLEKILKQSFDVETASTASKAEEKLSSCPYDLCLLDFHLPDYNGLELMKIIKEICPKTKVIIMTASFVDCDDELSENIQHAMQNGACHFIPKPFNLRDVTDVVDRALKDEDKFHTGFRLAGNSFVQKKRKFPRAPYSETINLFMTVIDQGEVKRWSLQAKSVDISNGGIGLLTNYPLRESQVVSFGEDLGNKTGVVVWSTMSDNEVCRAGVKFA